MKKLSLFAFVFITVSTVIGAVYLSNKTSEDLTVEESSAATKKYELSFEGENTSIDINEIFAIQTTSGEQVHSQPKKGTFLIEELSQTKGNYYPFTPKDILTDKDCLMVRATQTLNENKTIYVYLRFNRDKATSTWWFNSAFLILHFKSEEYGDLYIKIASILPQQVKSENWEAIYNAKFSDLTAPYGEEIVFPERLEIPMYRFAPGKPIRWGTLVLKSAKFNAFTNESPAS